ncbi:histidine triad nucleotide-binding protein [Roseisolibacter agri]|uniref:histidine triad nucleotide-binding protein n=1 Tax=Roseisolibacter agri TaxID=2014610 RepID=UPI0024E101E3|nr:histidine triad nucleotide-binding protein [Roseisolibacter agri]
MSDSCLFCRVVRGEIPATLVAETAECVAFRDINPQAPLHVLVIPREHVASLNEATDAAQLGRLSLLAAEIARREGYAETGYRTVVNTGPQAGQTVHHVHLHLLAGRDLRWPPG